MATLTEHLSTNSGKRATRWIGAVLGVVIVLLIGAGVWLHHWIEGEVRNKLFQKWSFEYQSDVSVRRLSISVFPVIRIVGHDLVFRLHDDPKSAPLVHAGRVIVTSGIVALFRSPHRFRHIEVFDAEANIPPHWHGPKSDGKPEPDHPKVETGQIDITNSVVRLLGEDPLVFPIRSIRFHGPGLGRHMDFKVDMDNAKPPGRIEAEGRFGPWNPSRSAELPLSGRYRLTNADLGAFGGIGGKLDSEGEFKGVLRRLATSGTIHVGGFEVTEAGHAVPLEVKFDAVVDGTNGNVALPSVAAGFLHTRLDGHGGFETPDGGKGKQFKLEAAMHDGHLDEILRLSLHDAKPPFGGVIRFESLVLIPPGNGDLVGIKHQPPENQRGIKRMKSFLPSFGAILHPSSPLTSADLGTDVPKRSPLSLLTRYDKHALGQSRKGVFGNELFPVHSMPSTFYGPKESARAHHSARRPARRIQRRPA